MFYLLLDSVLSQRTRTRTTTALARATTTTRAIASSIPTLLAPTFSKEPFTTETPPVTGIAIILISCGFIALLAVVGVIAWKAKLYMQKKQMETTRGLNFKL